MVATTRRALAVLDESNQCADAQPICKKHTAPRQPPRPQRAKRPPSPPVGWLRSATDDDLDALPSKRIRAEPAAVCSLASPDAVHSQTPHALAPPSVLKTQKLRRRGLSQQARNFFSVAGLERAFDEQARCAAEPAKVIGLDDALWRRGYCPESHEQMRRLEYLHAVPANFMQHQPEVTYQMREFLVDWLFEVQSEYSLRDHTVHLAVRYVDRLLATTYVAQGHLQLLGITCLFIAAKFDEVRPPPLSDFLYVCDGVYRKEQVLKMESLILWRLSFNLASPTPAGFLDRHLQTAKNHIGERRADLGDVLERLSLLYADYALHDSVTASADASLIAAASLHVALIQSGLSCGWPTFFEHLTGYTLRQILPTAKRLVESFRYPAARWQTISAKYGSFDDYDWWRWGRADKCIESEMEEWGRYACGTINFELGF